MAQQQPSIDEFLAGYDLQVQEIALRARASLIKSIPGCSETLDTKARVIGYGYGARYADTICVLILSKAGVKLGLPFGSTFPDPKDLL
jgi:hypothetical protein